MKCEVSEGDTESPLPSRSIDDGVIEGTPQPKKQPAVQKATVSKSTIATALAVKVKRNESDPGTTGVATFQPKREHTG